MDITKNDWKLFRERIGEWQGRHMEKLCGEYAQILALEKSGPERFWELEKRIRQDKKSPGVQLELVKDQMPYNIVALIREGTIDDKDLEGFSEGLKEMVDRIMSA